MSTWKLSKSGPKEAPDQPTVHGAVDTDSPPPSAPHVEILEIDVDSSLDCDPYNRTGQFCVIELKNKEQSE